MVFVRLLSKLLRDEKFGKFIVPIIPDESRTFGMEPLFRQVGIYSHVGQLYEPVDRETLLYYREAQDGQILEEGITEAGSMSSFIAAGHRVRHSPHSHSSFLCLLFDVWLSARRRSDLGRRRLPDQRLSDWRHLGPDDTCGRGTAAPGWAQPFARVSSAKSESVRSRLRFRIGCDHQGRNPTHVRTTRGRFLLPHGYE